MAKFTIGRIDLKKLIVALTPIVLTVVPVVKQAIKESKTPKIPTI